MSETITLAHSPDSDDAFMFYGLATHKLNTGDLKFEHLLKDIQTLNEEAMRGTYDVTAISFHAFAYIHEKYALLPHGASIGDNYGPIVVSREAATPDDIPNLKIAIPGKLTSAFLALRIFNSDFEYEVVPFDKIIDAVQDGTCDAGLLIHEGQLFYESKGLHKVLDLGEWWHQQHGLPLPMGGNAIRRDLGVARRVAIVDHGRGRPADGQLRPRALQHEQLRPAAHGRPNATAASCTSARASQCGPTTRATCASSRPSATRFPTVPARRGPSGARACRPACRRRSAAR